MSNIHAFRVTFDDKMRRYRAKLTLYHWQPLSLLYKIRKPSDISRDLQHDIGKKSSAMNMHPARWKWDV